MSTEHVPTAGAPGSLIRRRHLLGVGLAATAGVTVPRSIPVARAAEGLPVVADGQPKAMIVTPTTSNESLQYAVDDLVRCIHTSTGAELAVVTVDDPAYDSFADTIIQLGFTDDRSADVSDTLAELDTDGFVIATNDNIVTIVGPTRYGTMHGAFEFLERYVGVRWLMPSALGEDIPAQNTITVTDALVVQEPAFTERVASAVTGRVPDESNFRGHVRLRSKDNFHHNLHAVFPPELYAEDHPEIYPLRDGVRYIPPAGVISGWNPSLTEPITVQIAAEYVLDRFRTHSGLKSVSLGANDSGGWCEAELDHPHYPGRNNFVGFLDMSDLYYGWLNQIAEIVAAEFPDRTIGCLAYGETQTAPSFPLHPMIVPYYARDRYGWVDPDFKARDLQEVEAWGNVANVMGWYDYVYGSTYALPRIYLDTLGEAYKAGAANHVTRQYGEAHANWGEGPKYWLYAKLLWDPSIDVEEAVTEWCNRFAGPAAGPAIRSYFRCWEDVWTREMPLTRWFDKQRSALYFKPSDKTYLEVAKDAHFKRVSRLLSTAKSRASEPKHRDRIDVLETMLRYYQAVVDTYPREVAPPTTESQALTMINDVSSTWQTAVAAAAYTASYNARYIDDPLRCLPSDPATKGLLWSGWNPHQIGGVIRYVSDHEPDGGPVSEALTVLAQDATADRMSAWAGLALLVASGADGIIDNRSFEAGDDNSADNAQFWVAGMGSITRKPASARSGDYGVEARGLKRGGVYLMPAVTPGLAVGRAHIMVPAGVNGDLTFTIMLHAGPNGSGPKLTQFNTTPVEFAEIAGTGWHAFWGMGDIPEMVEGVAVQSAKVGFTINTVLEADTDPAVHLDDFDLWTEAQLEA